MANIIVVDDSRSIRQLLGNILTRSNYRVVQAASGEEAIKLMREDIFDIAIVDLIMEDVDGIQLLKAIKEIFPDIEVIMITGYDAVDMAVEAMKMGAYDFVTKPINMEELTLIIERALEKQELADNVRALQTQVKERCKFTNLIGSSSSIQPVLTLIEKVSQFDTAVLITGESGTGKDLVAQIIHANSSRRSKPFVPVNCAALPEDIQESELFGHRKGAFTGAIGDKKGLLEKAHGGTAFLDEIADASPATQAKLLRFLEDGEIRRIGDNIPIHVDVRLIVATNKDLSKAVSKKTFREDLYYRINVIKIHLPPLRDRKDDIPPLIQHFLQKHAHHTGKDMPLVSREALSILMEYNWPGNVRELQNAIQHSVAFAQNNTISPSSLPPYIRNGVGDILLQSRDEPLSLCELKKAYTIHVLEECSWNCAKAAVSLGIGRSTLYRKLKDYGIILPLRSARKS